MDPVSLKEWRKTTDKTQADVAALLGMTRGAYALVEQGRARLSAAKSSVLAAIVNAPVDTPESESPKKTAVRRTTIPLGTPAMHQATSKIVSAFFKDTEVAHEEYIALYTRIAQALG